MISYSQNFEDVILGRVFKHVSNGFYIDIGAQDPIRDSTSKHFYDQGWSGINVEPVPKYASRLRETRSRDIVIEKVVTHNLDEIEFYLVHDTGLSTASLILASNYTADGRFVEKVLVETASLDNILELANGKEVHWLKIDVEGNEKSVLTSWKDSKVRPWVLVIESTEPNSQVSTHLEWEKEVESRDYFYVYGDGLNRFYLHKDFKDLSASFVYPPNIFDEFELSGTASQPFCRLINLEIFDLKNLNQSLNLEIEALQSTNQSLNLEIEALQSTSQSLKLEIEALKARFSLTKWGAKKLRNKYTRKLLFEVKTLVFKLTQEMPWVQNQIRLLWRHGLRKRFGHFLFKVSSKNVPLELISESTQKVQNFSKRVDQNLVSILQKKVRNHENRI